MTQEQIIDAGISYTMQKRPNCIGGSAFDDMVRQLNRNPAFEAGATWAKEELIKEACEWLYNNAEDYTIDGGLSIECLIYSFKKAMEE